MLIPVRFKTLKSQVFLMLWLIGVHLKSTAFVNLVGCQLQKLV